VQNIIDGIVRTKLFEKIGLIQTLQIFNQLVDAIPASSHFIEYILELTRKVHLIGMLDESTRLLENYTQRPDVRLTPQKQLAVFLQLVDFYIKGGVEAKIEGLIAAIEKRPGLTSEELGAIQVAKARVALLQNKDEEVFKLLKDNHSLHGLKLKSAMLWAKEDWSGVVDCMWELIEKYADQLDDERKERYIVHLAAALVLNEQKQPSKNIARQATQLTLQTLAQKYENVLSRYKPLFDELIHTPHNSMNDVITKKVVVNELNETDRLEKLFNHAKAIPTH